MKIHLIKREARMTLPQFQKKYGDDLIAAIVAFVGNAASNELEATGDEPSVDEYDASLEHNITCFYNAYLDPDSTKAADIQKWIKTEAENPVDTTVETVEAFVNDWFTLTEKEQYELWAAWETWAMRRINEQIADIMDRGEEGEEGGDWD